MLNRDFFKSTIFFLYVFLLPNHLIYADCRTADLRKPGFSMERVEQRYQGELGICYAHSALKAFESKLKSSNLVDAEFSASIIAGAVLYTTANTEVVPNFRGLRGPYANYVCNVLEANDFCSTINFLKHDGVCSEKMVEGYLHAANEHDIGKGTALIQDLLKLLSLYYPNLKARFEEYGDEIVRLRSIAFQLGKQVSPAEKKEALDAYYKLQDEAFFKDPKKLDEIRNAIRKPSVDDFNNLNCMQNGSNRLDQLESLIQDIKPALELVDPLLTIRKAIEILCGPKIMISKELAETECKELIQTNERNLDIKISGFRKFVDDEFQKGIKADPIGIVYDGHLLIPTLGPKEHAVHTSLLIARKEINGVCHYLIRNSWGQGCDKYSFECEDGDPWIPEDRLFENTMSLADPFYSPSKN